MPIRPDTNKQLRRFLVVYHDGDRYRTELFSMYPPAKMLAETRKGVCATVYIKVVGMPDDWRLVDCKMAPAKGRELHGSRSIF